MTNYVNNNNEVLVMRGDKEIGKIKINRLGNVEIKLSAFVVLTPYQLAELNRRVMSMDREVKRKRDFPKLI